MLFYDSVGPNPRVVRVFAAERGVELPSTKVDLRGGENRQSAYIAKNPSGQLPALELDNGLVRQSSVPRPACGCAAST